MTIPQYDNPNWNPNTRTGLFIRALKGESVELPQEITRWECWAAYMLGKRKNQPIPMTPNEELLAFAIKKWKEAEEKLKQEAEE